jgi:Zn-dependent metalloprotease
MKTGIRRFLYAGVFLGLGACAVDDSAPQPQTPDDDAAASIASDHFASLGSSVTTRSVFHDDLGAAHVRVQQQVDGLPVFEGEAIAHLDPGGIVTSVTDDFRPVGSVDLTPSVDINDAIVETAGIAQVRDGTASADLTLYVSADDVTHLAWNVELVRDDGNDPIDQVALIDAHDRAVLLQYSKIETGKPGGGGVTGTGVAAAGTGKSLYAGTVGLGTEVMSNGTYGLIDLGRGGQQVSDMGHKTSGSGTLDTDADDVFGSGSTSDAATVAVDAAYGASMTWDYYRNVHGRNGIRNDGVGAASRVHYGRSYNNAFWSDACFCMSYGDGDGRSLGPVVALDVAGHEMTHGVTAATAALVYSGESGGLNEAISDIFGTSVEFYANNASEPGNYLIGEKVYTPGTPGDALRYMDHPAKDGGSVDNYSKYTSSLDVHYSSGIANNAFYLLSEGGTNDTSHLTVSGITRAKAEKIFYRALTVYMTSGTNFHGARVACLSAAGDLYGVGGAEYNATAAAWSAVGVN